MQWRTPPESRSSTPIPTPQRCASRRHRLYDPADEHDACGVGLIASTLDGKPRREVVAGGHRGAGKAVWHRGAPWTPMEKLATAPASMCRSRRPSSRITSASAPAQHDRAGEARGRPWSSCRAPTSAAQERWPASWSSARSSPTATTIYWLAPGAGECRRDRREGQCNAARDRADHDLPTAAACGEEQFEVDLYVIRRRIEKAALEEQASRISTSARCHAAR